MNSNPIKNRICLVIPSLHAGGMERVMSELAGYFAAKPSIELHLILYGIKREIFYKLPTNITIHKPAFEFENNSRILYTIKTLFFLRKKINSLKPSSVLSFGEYWNSFVLMALLGSGLPVFVSDRCQPDKYLGKVQEILRKWLYPTATGMIAQTNTAKQIYQNSKLNRNIEIVGNPVRHIDGSALAKKENIILTVGRLIKSKHHDELIRLFLKIDRPGWKLVIVGDDAQKQNNMIQLKNLVKSLNGAERVIFAGKQFDVEAFYRKSKIFAFASSSEGFPNVIGEAQSTGLPVVAFDCIAGPSDLITDKVNGFLIPLFDYECFQKKLELLMDNDELIEKFGKDAKASVSKFSVENIGRCYENFILGS